MIVSRRMRWAGNLAEWGEEECIQGFGVEIRRKETTSKTDIGGRIILKWILEK
jgi:hypothetical protein